MTSFKDAVKSSHQGVLLCLHVMPASAHSVFPVRYNPWRKCIEISVQSEAKENKANTEVVETIARFFQKSSKEITLVSGQKSREKTVLLHNMSSATVCRRLEESLHG